MDAVIIAIQYKVKAFQVKKFYPDKITGKMRGILCKNNILIGDN